MQTTINIIKEAITNEETKLKVLTNYRDELIMKISDNHYQINNSTEKIKTLENELRTLYGHQSESLGMYPCEKMSADQFNQAKSSISSAVSSLKNSSGNQKLREG